MAPRGAKWRTRLDAVVGGELCTALDDATAPTCSTVGELGAICARHAFGQSNELPTCRSVSAAGTRTRDSLPVRRDGPYADDGCDESATVGMRGLLRVDRWNSRPHEWRSDRLRGRHNPMVAFRPHLGSTITADGAIGTTTQPSFLS